MNELEVHSSALSPGHDARKNSRTIPVVAALAVIALCLCAALAAWVVSLGPLPLAQARQVSTTIIDRNGKVLVRVLLP